ncbi:histidyl-tRNA synthetase [Alkalihalobacillus alcalophilus ATCC 27647 = CGMCC 1.3604]|uniref:Histidine--tRNA ligase n=1 Tax=Alkalihalobacillus alcalophilus ATCC 27647 = CGMCC 1.3604 TaxID=1218173 RepID=A0A094XCH0_ALKAL|nr:histidine--tRNA ligase [Alkalihalobacillus alcalophilus]KGA96500.1 histidyl-tRNA synthetase [Alkalihalobacillus alcalophilus ATCC 27647 = CGMCC 1.3604]MED1562418.1 histidine--tRNA ligase [Alkalihalobacillus alcalophilus]THG90848.1 histidyl-tRNA synthetase [Alkalihalobacillus alcalophilus ATCC 27647 = CGMCC 1.3604]
MNIQIPRGTQDILPGDIEIWQHIEETAKKVCERYNYQEIRTPIFEHTELFQRGVGDTTDIVQKEMYTFTDRGERNLTLRPEGTAGVVRSFVENKLYGQANQPTKLYYTGPMFRYERPQAGRMRQFVQFGVEALGSADPAIDAEVLSLVMRIYKELGVSNLKLVVNSLGDSESRTAHRQALIDHFKPNIAEFCSDCQGRLEKNPLRILDCKKDSSNPLMDSAPSILDYLNEESSQYFEQVKSYLDAIELPYEVDPTLVRGLDYYNHTAFELMAEGEGFGAITTLCGGGRYNGLVESLGGPSTPGIGFAFSIERLIMALKGQNKVPEVAQKLDCYLVTLGEQAKLKSVELLEQLRAAGIKADKDYLDKKMKAQFKAADRLQAAFTAVLGDDELANNIINVKNMETGTQEQIALDELTLYIEKEIQGGK